MVEVEDRDRIAEWTGALLVAGCAVPISGATAPPPAFVAWFEQQNHELFAPAPDSD